MATISLGRGLRSAERPVELMGSAVSRLIRVLVAWQVRAAERVALERLDDAALKDIGLSRADVAGESRKPFWRE